MAENIFNQAKPASTDTVQTKKSKKGLFIGLIIAVVLAVAGVTTFVIVQVVTNTPEHIALKTIQNTLRETNVTTTGTVRLKFANPSDFNNLASVKISFSGQSKLLPSSLTAQATMTDTSDRTYHLAADLAISADGIFYLKTDDLSDLFKLTGASASQLRQYSTFTEMIEGKWWSFNLADFYNLASTPSSSVLFGGESTTLENPVAKFITCATDLISDYKADPSTTADLYAEHPFITFTPADGQSQHGGQLYHLSLDQDLARSFLRALRKSPLGTNAMQCFQDLTDSTDLDLSNDNFSTDEQSDTLQDQLNNLIIEVKNYHIVGYTSTLTHQDVAVKAQFSFAYGPTDITIPAKSTSVTDLLQNFLPTQSYGSSYLDY